MRTKLRPGVIAIAAGVVLASIFPLDLLTSAPTGPRGADGQFSGRQGDVLLVRIHVPLQTSGIFGRFLNRRIPFFRDSASGVGKYVGLVGIDLQDAPGFHELVVEFASAGEARRLSYNVLVMKEQHSVQHLTLPRELVELDEASLARVKSEQEQVQQALEHISAERFWNDTFIPPVEGPVTGAFGRVRVINGQVRTPHNGEDIAAPLGAAVVVMNDGVVRLTVDHFFSGKGVFVDHGLGLYSMYFHLSEVLVQNGQPVKRGQVIGKVGASGRATGPHLHWGVRLNGARIDPFSLIKISFD